MEIPLIGRGVSVKDYIPGQPIPDVIIDALSGRPVVNPLKKFVKPYTLSIEPEVITLPASQEPTDFIPMPIDGKGHFEVMHGFFKSEQPEGFTVRIFDPDQRPLLHQPNRELHVATIASGGGTATLYEVFGAVGSAGRAFRWPETFFMDEKFAGKCLFVQFRNLSAVENDIRFSLHGLKWYHLQAPQKVAERMQQIYRSRFASMPFFYTTDQFVTIPSGTDETDPLKVTIRFTDEAYTEWIKSMVVKSDPDQEFRVRISETASNKRYMEDFLPDSQVFGDGEFPFLNWETAVFEPDFQITLELTNAGAEDLDVYLTLGCRKILPDPVETSLIRPGVAPGGGL